MCLHSGWPLSCGTISHILLRPSYWCSHWPCFKRTDGKRQKNWDAHLLSCYYSDLLCCQWPLSLPCFSLFLQLALLEWRWSIFSQVYSVDLYSYYDKKNYEFCHQKKHMFTSLNHSSNLTFCFWTQVLRFSSSYSQCPSPNSNWPMWRKYSNGFSWYSLIFRWATVWTIWISVPRPHKSAIQSVICCLVALLNWCAVCFRIVVVCILNNLLNNL